MGVAVGISLPSCIRAQIYVISYPLPVNGRHLCFTTFPDMGQHSQLFIPVVWPRKHGCSRTNFVAIMFTSWDKRNCLSTSGQWPPSLLYEIPKHWTESLFFTVCFMALKTCYYLWNCVDIMYIGWYTYYYKISAAILDFWLPVSSGSVTDNTIERFDRKNIGVAVRILFIASLEAEIPLGGLFNPRPLQHKRYENNLQHLRVKY